VSPQRAVDNAILICLIFATLWLIFAALGMSGVSLAEGATLNSLVQGTLIFSLALILAARWRDGHRIAAGLGLAIYLTPIISAGLLPELPRPRRSYTASLETVQSRLVEQFSRPVALRPQWARLATGHAKEVAKFEENPFVKAEFERYKERMSAYFREHSQEVFRLRAEMSRQHQGPPPERQSQADFERNFFDGLESVQSSYQKFSFAFLDRLKESGINVGPTPLPEEDRKKAERSAQVWLQEHQDWIRNLMASGPAYTGDPIPTDAPPPDLGPSPEDQFRRAKAFGNPAIWVVVGVVYLAWRGRQALVEPRNPASLLPLALSRMAGFVRPGGLPRILAGLCLMGASFLVLFALLASGSGFGLRRLFAGLTVAGACLIYSGLTPSGETGQAEPGQPMP